MITAATIQSAIAQGLLWAVLTLGVYLTYRVLGFSDLGCEGSFPLGAAVSVVLMNGGVHPLLAAAAAMLCGAIAGAITGVLHTVFKIPDILAGILTMISLYSINIRIMSGKATVTIASDTLKSIVGGLFPQNTSSYIVSIVTGAIFCLIIVGVLYYYFGTEVGCSIRATGDNAKMARAVGVNTDMMIVLCLVISNSMIALAGNLIAQFDYGSALVNMGQGTIVIGLASIIIGEVLFVRDEMNFALKMFSVVAGAVIYRIVIACALTLPWLKATDLKLITAVTVAIALALPVVKQKMALRAKRRAALKEAGNAEA
ncbi:MAG: ABC transporter permease [Clostridiales bacterium]|nr:ABC transporter permease [Clostridiales bacterium]